MKPQPALLLPPGTSLSRRSLLRGAGLLGLGALAGPALVACGSGGTTASTGAAAGSGSGTPGAPTAGGTLRAALTGEPDSLDPAVSAVYTGAQVYDNIFSKLVDLDADGNLVGDLATKWTATDDTTWVFDLATGITWHNGETFGPADVKYTFERIADPATASAYAPLFAAIESVEVTGDAQVTFTLSSTYAPFLTNLANNGEIMNEKAVTAADPARNPVGTGPFQFVEWVQGDHLTVKKFDGYFDQGHPFLDGVEFRFLLVDQGRIDALSAGEIDWMDAVPLQQVATLTQDPRFTLVTNPVSGIPDFLAMNTTKAPFDKKEVRQAVAWAINRSDIRDLAYFGTGEVGVQEVPTGSVWYDGQDPFAGAPDVAKAKALLATAGYPDGLTVNYLGLPQYPELLKTGQVVRDQLKEIGITMEIEQVDVSIWFDRFSSGDYEITSAYQERTIDPDNFYSLVIRSGGSVNTTGYANPEVDAMIDAAAAEIDEAKRKEMYTAIRAAVAEDAPITFVHYETLNYLMTTAVVGSTITPSLELNLGDVGLTG
ncbi:hypothetical protein JL107_16440 [Nakamurella flavida]|uniref:Solute-binding protein family 5 domain-containing protein n=1 Tax=Nakamurella flavida TaxID=363630 RepID=A0A938YRC7_9ACTN|nr:ABC transporter substrate-binding protein [Nakamurella flavida]MBM9478039.1 hypothetical protein [Nakamurella flavida]MDP9778244.1 peptide/nickel transport system substrate-binding protein [Nakamurella flavida]